jgi:hypothetical protein
VGKDNKKKIPLFLGQVSDKYKEENQNTARRLRDGGGGSTILDRKPGRTSLINKM